MTRTEKIDHCDIFYRIVKERIELDVIDLIQDHPNVHIRKNISTDHPEFWDFVFDAVIELKQHMLDTLDNEEGDLSFEQMKRGYVVLESLTQTEKGLTGLVSKTKIGTDEL